MNDFDFEDKKINADNNEQLPEEPQIFENEASTQDRDFAQSVESADESTEIVEPAEVTEPVESAEPIESTEVVEPAEPINQENSSEEPNQAVENPPQNNQQWSPYAHTPNQNQYSYNQENKQSPQNQYPYSNNNYDQYPYGNSQPTMMPPKKSKKGIGIFSSVLALVVVISIVAASFSHRLQTNTKENITTSLSEGPTLSINETPSVTGTSAGNGLLPVDVYKKIQPSMVGVLVYSQQTNSLSGEGSGVIMGEDAEGKYTYIVTCAHVINSPGVNTRVRLGNGNEYEATIVGFDTRTDVGVLKVEATGLTAAEFGSSKELLVGQSVYAVGNSGGSNFFSSFTDGIISGMDRIINSNAGYNMVTIQHNAAMSPGISGGALVNAHGQVIGINSAKLASDLVEGMNFSIPISDAKEIIDKLIAHGYVPDRPKLGIKYSTTSVSQMYSMIVQLRDLPNGSLIIREIGSDSDLANTNARVNDLIIAVDGVNLDTPDVLLDKIEQKKVGDTLKLTICRITSDYKTSTFDVDIKLVEDKGSTETEAETTTQPPVDYFNPWG